MPTLASVTLSLCPAPVLSLLPDPLAASSQQEPFQEPGVASLSWEAHLQNVSQPEPVPLAESGTGPLTSMDQAWFIAPSHWKIHQKRSLVCVCPSALSGWFPPAAAPVEGRSKMGR